MTAVKCPSCGNEVDVPEKKSGLPWLIGCLVAVVAIPIVVGLIGMLAAIAVPSFVKARHVAQMNACVNNMRMIESAAEAWALSNEDADRDSADVTVVTPFMAGNALPACPAMGTYTFHGDGYEVECSVHGRSSNPRPFR
jgi:hypothetical protein